MVKNNIKRFLTYAALTASLTMGSGLSVLALDNESSNMLTITRDVNLMTDDIDADFSEHFEPVIEEDGKSYILTGINMEVLQEEIVEGDYFYYISPAFIDEEKTEKPEENLERGGIIYQLKDARMEPATVYGRTEYVETEVILDGLEWIENIPKTSEIAVTDKASRRELKVTVPFISLLSDKQVWIDTFHFPIVINHYDAEYFMLGDVQVSKNEELINYSEAFLSYLGLPSDQYQITKIEWDGESYIKNGEVLRNATARGEKRVHDVIALYGGEVSLPEAKGWKYHCTYVNPDESERVVYSLKLTALYEHELLNKETSGSLLQQLMKWLKESPIQAFTLATLLLIAFIILMLFIFTKKKAKGEDEKRVDIIDLK